MNLNDYLIPDFDLTGNLTTEDTLYGLLSDDEEITGYLGLIEDIALSELSDVTLTSPVNGQVLKYDNGTWVNANETGGGSADYNLLLNKPSINTVPLTGNKTTAELGLFSGDYDDLTNKPSLATVATTGNYNDLSNRPTIPAAQVNADWDAVAGVSQILNKPSLAAVATSGDYDDLINAPTLATVATSGDYDDLINTPVQAYEYKGQISDLNNVDLDNGGAYKYIFNAGASNKPSSGGGTLLHMWNSGNHAWGCQVVFSDTGMYFRGVNNSVFGTWRTIVTA